MKSAILWGCIMTLLTMVTRILPAARPRILLHGIVLDAQIINLETDNSLLDLLQVTQETVVMALWVTISIHITGQIVRPDFFSSIMYLKTGIVAWNLHQVSIYVEILLRYSFKKN